MRDRVYGILIYSLCALSLGAVIYIVAKHLLPLLLPFLFAWLIVALASRGAERLAYRLRIPRKILRLVISLTLVILLSLTLWLVIRRSISSLSGFLSDVAESNGIFSLLEQIFSEEKPFFSNMFPEELARVVGESLNRVITSAMTAVGNAATSLAKGLPNAFLFLLVTIISIIYFALDYDVIRDFVMGLLPDRVRGRIAGLKESVLSVMGGYIRSYALILLITYLTLFLGLSLIRVEHSPIIALLVAFLDILPVIGVGTVLVPWSLISFALGDKFLGIGLMILFVVNALIRQLAEPKILGKSLNIHPLVSLWAVYLGYALFGIAGLFILPLIAVLVSAFLKNNSSAEIHKSVGGQ